MEADLEYSSPIGLVKKYPSGIVHVHINELSLSKEMLEGHYNLLPKYFGETKMPFILSFDPNYVKMDAVTRRYNNDMMNHWSTAMGVVVVSPLLRAFVSMYMRVNPLIYDVKICSDLDEAHDFLLNYLPPKA
jgi:hypothetical protein